VSDLFEGRVDWKAVMARIGSRFRDAIEVAKVGPPARLLDLRIPRGAITDHAPIYYASFLKEQLANEQNAKG
jgi:hypothetical protein